MNDIHPPLLEFISKKQLSLLHMNFFHMKSSQAQAEQLYPSWSLDDNHLESAVANSTKSESVVHTEHPLFDVVAIQSMSYLLNSTDTWWLL